MWMKFIHKGPIDPEDNKWLTYCQFDPIGTDFNEKILVFYFKKMHLTYSSATVLLYWT